MTAIIRRHAIGVIALVATASAPASALGQPRWLVLGAGAESESDELLRWTARVATELQGTGGRTVMSTDEVDRQIREQISLPFQPPPTELDRDLRVALEPAIFAAAEGDAAGVRTRVEPLLTRSEVHLASLNRITSVFNDLGNLCYLVVRSHLYQRRQTLARDATLRCLRIAPDFHPGSDIHPPDVRRMYDEVVQRIAEGDAASLSIDAPTSGDGSPCRIEVNGRNVGQTPSVRQFVPEGTYFVGLVCGDDASPRRVRRVMVARDTPVRVLIDPVLDRALARRGNLLLYERADGLPGVDTLDSHARRIGEAVHASGILLVTARRGAVEIRRIPTSVRARISESDANDFLDDAVAAVVAGRSYEGAATARDVPTETGSRGRPILGPVLLGVAGLASIGVIAGGALASGCADRASDGFCERESSLSPGAAAVYAGLGAAAIAGAIIWFVLGARDTSAEASSARAAREF